MTVNNRILGTYSVAVLCKHHNIPFHAVAPVSTVDFECPDGSILFGPIDNR